MSAPFAVTDFSGQAVAANTPSRPKMPSRSASATPPSIVVSHPALYSLNDSPGAAPLPAYAVEILPRRRGIICRG